MNVLWVVSDSSAQADGFQKATDDILRKYTSVGNIGLTVTNYGTIGTRNSLWPRQPSCEYPRGSRIEHIYQAALWVGALVKTENVADPRNNQFLVTTGSNDRSSSSRTGEGVEFNTELGDTITELSSLSDDRPPESQYSPLAISHQDFLSDFRDHYTRVPGTGDSILYHQPLNIRVHSESYAYNFPFADFFVILKYQVINESLVDTLDSVYVGFWANAVVRNTSLVRPGTPGYFEHGAFGYDSTMRMAYGFDFDGIPGTYPADSYVGIKLLGTTPFPSGVDSLADLLHHTYYNAWRFRSNSGEQVYFSPDQDGGTGYTSRYARMAQSIPDADIERLHKVPPAGVAPVNATYLISTGPFSKLAPGDTTEVVFAIVCAKKKGTAPARDDSPDQRSILNTNAGWAQQAYNGEDVNGNNLLDPGEDIAGRDSNGLSYEADGKITRYLLPTPPRRPKVRAEVSDSTFKIYWDKSTAEESIDPITGIKDFEGYRIYRSKTGDDFLNHEDFLINLSLVGEFDRRDNTIGYNTGFGKIALSSAKTFPGDTVQYWYEFPPNDTIVQHLNGWQYTYGVSAFDKGDSANGVLSLESAKALARGFPGTAPTSSLVKEIGVYPNPYYGNAYWDGGRERQRKIYFYNLPALCEIKIYTLAGDIVAVLDHNAATYAGEDINWFADFGDPGTKAQFAGGEHAWDLITKHDQAIATGLYLFTVEDRSNGVIKRGKFVIIK